MIRFQTRDDILRWLIAHCPRKAIVRSLLQDRVVLLGGFKEVPPSKRPGWLLKVRSVFDDNKTWIVAIIPNVLNTDYEIRILKRIPWEKWCGSKTNNPVYRGDKPWLYALSKERAATQKLYPAIKTIQ